jgi:hypothetical protein
LKQHFENIVDQPGKNAVDFFWAPPPIRGLDFLAGAASFRKKFLAASRKFPFGARGIFGLRESPH